jgi:hypothetical protein
LSTSGFDILPLVDTLCDYFFFRLDLPILDWFLLPVSRVTLVGYSLPPGATLNLTVSPLFGPLVTFRVDVLPDFLLFAGFLTAIV